MIAHLILLVALVATGDLTIALGGRGGSHNTAPYSSILRTSGPILRGQSNHATSFEIYIDDQSYTCQAFDGLMEFDLFPLRLKNGKHHVKIVPIKFVVGYPIEEAPPVIFDLQITGKNPRLWQILMLPKEIETNPNYKGYFSPDLAIYITN